MKSSEISRRTLRNLAVCSIISTVGLTACKKAPEGVIQQEEMAQLMADIHLGEAMIDFNYSSYPNDSTRKLLKQSIFTAHNVTAEEVDTSFVWYGNHIEEYIKVYDRTIEILEERQHDNRLTSSEQISIAGDSVQVWSGPQRLVVSSRMPSRIITFNLLPDSTWQNGDIYTLYYKPVNGLSQVRSRLLVDYAEGTTHYVDETSSRQGPNKLKIQVDSTLTPLKVYGYITLSPERNTAFEIDSLSLTRVRKSLDHTTYFPHTTFNNGNKVGDIEKDSSADNTGDLNQFETENITLSSGRRAPSGSPHQRTTPSTALPQSSSAAGEHSEHRRDANLHKPTPQQRREATKRRNASQPAKPVRTIDSPKSGDKPTITRVPQKNVPATNNSGK